MCGRFAVTQPRFTHIEHALGTTFAPVPPSYNIAPTQPISVIRQIEDVYVMSEMKWGLVPAWSKTPSTPYSTFNAKQRPSRRFNVGVFEGSCESAKPEVSRVHAGGSSVTLDWLRPSNLPSNKNLGNCYCSASCC